MGSYLKMIVICLSIVNGLWAVSDLMVAYIPEAINSRPTCYNTLVNEPLNMSYLWSTTADYLLVDDTICSMMSNWKKAYGFTYNDGVCTLYGPGECARYDRAWFGPPNVTLPPLNDLEEIARNKPTIGSTSYGHFDKDWAVDGNPNTMYHSQFSSRQWWQVDLGEQRTIYQIHYLPRFDCCGERTRDIEIRVGKSLKTDGDFSSYRLMAFFKGPYDTALGYLVSSSQEGFVGRYVVVAAMHDENLPIQIVEVAVYALRL